MLDGFGLLVLEHWVCEAIPGEAPCWDRWHRWAPGESHNMRVMVRYDPAQIVRVSDEWEDRLGAQEAV